MPRSKFGVTSNNLLFMVRYVDDSFSASTALATSFTGGDVEAAKAAFYEIASGNTLPTVEQMQGWFSAHLSERGAKRIQGAFNQSAYLKKKAATGGGAIILSGEVKGNLDKLISEGFADTYNNCIAKLLLMYEGSSYEPQEPD